MKISMTPISLSQTIRGGEMTLEGFVRYCAELELDGVDILDTLSYPWLWNDKDREFKALPGWIEQSGLKLAAYATGNNFSSLKPENLQPQIERVRHALQEAAELGAPILRIFGGHLEQNGGEPGVQTHNGLQRVVQGIEKCLPEAERLGIIMALENHGGLPGHAYEVAAVIQAFSSPFLQCTFDCGNFMGNNMDEPEDPLRAYEILHQNVVHVHVKDNGPSIVNSRKLHGYVTGMGIVPLRQLIAMLERNGYPGFCSLEYEASLMVPEEYGVPQSIRYLKSVREIHRALQSIKPSGKDS